MNTTNQGAKRKDFSRLPIDDFLIERFCKFSIGWKPSDLSRLAITWTQEGRPVVRNPELVKTLIRVAVEPEKIGSDSNTAKLFFSCLKRSPDFVIALALYLRQQVAGRKESNKDVLFGKDQEKLTHAQTEYRGKLRELANENDRAFKKAMKDRDALIQQNLSEPAPWRPTPKSTKKINQKKRQKI